jgi:hypothetical protein
LRYFKKAILVIKLKHADPKQKSFGPARINDASHFSIEYSALFGITYWLRPRKNQYANLGCRESDETDGKKHDGQSVLYGKSEIQDDDGESHDE